MTPHQRRLKLSRIQAQYKDAIKWLYDDDCRQEGRTTLQVIALCELALEDPGMTYYLRDHASRSQFYHDHLAAQAIDSVIRNHGFEGKVARVGMTGIRAKI